jgi:ribose transport system ATP-binding protein
MTSVEWSLKDLSKSFPGVKALDGVSLELRPGAIHALVGENGCGKSTLIKVLSGVHQPDHGGVMRDGTSVTFTSTKDARAAGVATIYQEFSLVPQLTVGENIVLGSCPVRGIFIDRSLAKARALSALALLDIHLDLETVVGTLSVADQQVVEIAKAVSVDSTLLILDEPTTTLSIPEVERLHKLITRLARAGKSILYVSHRLEELFGVANQTTVMRDGEIVGRFGERPAIAKVVQAMVGRSVNQFYSKASNSKVEIAMRAVGLATDRGIRDVTFDLHRGEVLGLAGVVGSGRTEIARAIFGVDPLRSGHIEIEGRTLANHKPHKSIARGIGYVPESRKFEGLFFNLSASKNMSIARLRRVQSGLFLDIASERREGRVLADAFRISSHAEQVQIAQLSGGNQQKIVLARWVFAQSKVLILDEPTQGIDVGAKQEVYRIMNDLTSAGISILLISSDLPELLAMSDRLAIVRRGTIDDVIDTGSTTELDLVELISSSADRSQAQ